MLLNKYTPVISGFRNFLLTFAVALFRFHIFQLCLHVGLILRTMAIDESVLHSSFYPFTHSHGFKLGMQSCQRTSGFVAILNIVGNCRSMRLMQPQMQTQLQRVKKPLQRGHTCVCGPQFKTMLNSSRLQCLLALQSSMAHSSSYNSHHPHNLPKYLVHTFEFNYLLWLLKERWETGGFVSMFQLPTCFRIH